MENRIAYQETDRLAAEINVIKQQAARTLLIPSIEIGERLTRAKSIIPHGEWEAWLKENVDYSQSTAQGFMKVYREYGGDQMNLSGNTPMEIFGNLTYTQALALIGLPPEERERFVKENDVEEMSTRELQKAVAEVKAAREEAEAERRRAEQAEFELSENAARIFEVENQLKASRDAADKFRSEKEAMSAEVNAARETAEQARMQRDRADAEIAELKTEIERLGAQRELSEEERAAIEAELAEKYEARINQMSLTIEAAEENAARLNEEKTAIEEKYRKAANTELVRFQALFEKFQSDTKELVTLADRIGGEQGEKLKGVLKKAMDLLISE